MQPTRRSVNACDKLATIAAQRRSAVSFISPLMSCSIGTPIGLTSVMDVSLISLSGNGDQADQACPNCLDHGVPCVTPSSRGHSHRNQPGPSFPYRGSNLLRESNVSRPAGLLSPDDTSVEFSVHPEYNQIADGNNTPALDTFDEPGERSSILPDDMVRHT